jgi:hypothetical protein
MAARRFCSEAMWLFFFSCSVRRGFSRSAEEVDDCCCGGAADAFEVGVVVEALPPVGEEEEGMDGNQVDQ